MSRRGRKGLRICLVILLSAAAVGPPGFRYSTQAAPKPGIFNTRKPQGYSPGFSERLVQAAKERTRHAVAYDGSYRRIDYPNGDVPDNVGVCADVVVRAYRKVGIDLQVELHEDMKRNFSLYPDMWGLKRPDPNIDHRRVPNLQVFFRRHGLELPLSRDGDDYLPGDLVTWKVAGKLPHIGIVSDIYTFSGRPLIIHNIGRGPVLEDMLFDYPITGHYRYYGGTPVISEEEGKKEE